MRSMFRKPSRGETVFLAVLTLVLGLLSPAVPFEPYDWVQQNATALINQKAYEGDGVVVAIDEETLQEIPGNQWKRRDLAQLLRQIERLKPDLIVVDRQYFSNDDTTSMEEVGAALDGMQTPVIWQVAVSSEEVGAFSASEPAPEEDAFTDAQVRLEPSLRGRVTTAVSALHRYPLATPLYASYAIKTKDGVLPSVERALSNAKSPPTNQFRVDLSIAPQSVPIVSAGAVLAGDAPSADLTGKQVIVSFTGNATRDTFATPGSRYTPRAVGSLMAAQTLIDGPALSIGWLPATLAGFAAILAWAFVKPPYGRIIALSTLTILIVSPLFFERHLIFLETSHGVFMILLFALGRFWQRVRKAIRTYRSAAETKARFLAQASHDLRQPIHAIGLLADRLAQSDLAPDQRELVSKISWSVDNASRMFRSLLDIAAIESGTLQPDIAPVSINEILAEIDSQNALAAEQAGVNLRLVPSELIIKTDRVLISTMLQNLVSNAIKYSPGKDVVIGCRRRKGSVALVVIDNGKGIPASELRHVQKEFYRASRASTLRSDNKGLGLAIVNRLAALLDLRFTLRSNEGRGTSAMISGLEVLSSVAAVEEATPKRALPLSGLRVAIADDDQETLGSTAELLRQWGCEVDAFDEFPRALTQHEILLSDYDFGAGNTLADKAESIAKLEAEGTRLIVISGHHSDQIRAQIEGFDGLILSKPLRAAELRSALMAAKIS